MKLDDIEKASLLKNKLLKLESDLRIIEGKKADDVVIGFSYKKPADYIETRGYTPSSEFREVALRVIISDFKREIHKIKTEISKI